MLWIWMVTSECTVERSLERPGVLRGKPFRNRKIHGLCGANSWCTYNPSMGRKCSCLPGYKVVNKDDWSCGCEPYFNRSCDAPTPATRGFKEEIGRGGGGIVYKGTLSDQRVAAIKQLDIANQGEAEFLAEVSLIGKLYHMNLIDMWGYCIEDKHRLLVYEYMEHGSLAKNLSSNVNVLDWNKRFEIAVGTAKGLAYLHEECLEWVLHCDIKPHKVLLDSEAPFGLLLEVVVDQNTLYVVVLCTNTTKKNCFCDSYFATANWAFATEKTFRDGKLSLLRRKCWRCNRWRHKIHFATVKCRCKKYLRRKTIAVAMAKLFATGNLPSQIDISFKKKKKKKKKKRVNSTPKKKKKLHTKASAMFHKYYKLTNIKIQYLSFLHQPKITNPKKKKRLVKATPTL
ncbi:putative protein kinase RLK-Pelle-SD-2b family [Rosa chinensis]|uniref:non-specific serine/threonine protein kinase n=1 Tax=Rosa chinensis TaxID=74649 RepID=A0A2P6Q0U7_ROSCH|nr:putative protein kinase RLK-Pelle-SD-2b family [Rosa chinensis]